MIAVFLIFLFCFGLYFMPFLIANARHSTQQVAIFLINLVFGWTILGWIGALVWAASSPAKT